MQALHNRRRPGRSLARATLSQDFGEKRHGLVRKTVLSTHHPQQLLVIYLGRRHNKRNLCNGLYSQIMEILTEILMPLTPIAHTYRYLERRCFFRRIKTATEATKAIFDGVTFQSAGGSQVTKSTR